MVWFKRVWYYLIGFTLGSIVVYFIWTGKEVSFDYGPDARTLKTIRIREKIYSDDANQTLKLNRLDTTAINYILQNGDVNFSKSDQRAKPCATYYIEGEFQDKLIDLIIVRCDSTSTIEKVLVK
ncbi:hypothetical protein GCM10011416_15120 [Polaribacter pacificus]|uniref:DUF4258 domain-containing protein n=1 Tax=Polaribacter pacificus TaxID=1775173 RepID=A0A917HYT0_9FLAO|nr:DUF4258 domain-containing protein [Polaribacter pacificus]GGG98018.1 hypothetical protein GCM10011416_15120 [Polaribacter pacificus]